MPGRWAGSQRRKTLPTNWPKLRTTILKRDGHQCTWMVNGHRCPNPATDVDHRDRHAGDHPTNLRSLCAQHHAQKTSAEGNTERWQHHTKRTPEQHPGLITNKTTTTPTTPTPTRQPAPTTQPTNKQPPTNHQQNNPPKT